MEPQQTPQVNTTSSQPPQQGVDDSQSLDPQAVNLAKAIRQTESGGDFTAKGKSGEYGAYQWEPATWSAESSSAGVNVPLDQSTPEQQNEVAYKQIEKYKSEGYNAGQIASLWNSGDADAYTGYFSDGSPSVGTNKDGVAYDVPSYVNKVTSAYQQLKSQSTPTNTQTTPQTNDSGNQPSWLIALEGLGAGGLSWLASSGKSLAGDAIKDVGAAGGAAFGAAIGGGPEDIVSDVAGGIAGEKVGEQIANSLGLGSTQSDTQDSTQTEQPQQTDTEIPQAVQASSAVKDALSQTINATQTGRSYSSTPQGQDAINTAAQYNLIHPDEEGNLSFNSEKLKELEGAIEQGKDGVISSQEGVTASPLSVANHAGSYIGRDKINTAADRQKAAKIVQNEIAADSGSTGMNGQMSLSDMRAAQKTHYQAAKASYTNPKPNAEMLAHKALGEAYGKSIRDKISDEDKPLYDKLTKTSRDLTNVKNLRKKVEGKKAPQNKGIWESFLRQGARAAEIYIGDKLGGPIGAIIGGLAGEHFNRALTNKFGNNIFETKGMKASLQILKDSKPKEYQNLIDALEKRGVKVPKESEARTEEGKVKQVKGDEKKLKGLVSLSRR